MVFGKRVDEIGGHRRAVRDVVMRRASIITTVKSRSVDLIDLSLTGAKLRGDDLPPEGQEVLLRLGSLEAFGAIVWSDDAQCGVSFDVPLTQNVLDWVARERGPSSLLDLSPDELLGAEDWANGFVR